MTEAKPSQPHPEEILAVKDEIVTRWDRLPAEHQATLALTLISKVSDSEYGAWLLSSIGLLNSEVMLSLEISNASLKGVGLSDEELSRLNETDHRNIRRQMINHWVQDVFPNDLEYLARKALAEKEANQKG